jgi:hypothetical protein
LRFKFVAQPHWPPLAWLARCEKTSPTVVIFHGPRVEVTDDWYCEAVWAGNYASGDFDQTDIVAGSGGRIRSDALDFVSSGSTIDRLQSLEADGAVWVSNSLACLMAAVGASVDPTYSGYYRDASSIIDGLDRYKRTLSTTVGDVKLTYFENLAWDGSQLRLRAKPAERRDLSSFARYRAFLSTNLHAIAENLAALDRRFPLRMLGTLSSGYDSTAVTVLAKAVGLDEVITFDKARLGGDDSGEAAARILGLRVYTVGRDAWRTTDYAEVPFIASYSSGEDIVFKGAEAHLGGRVLMTGYHGDKLWDKFTKKLSDQIVRGDPSGLALTEYRLWVGFINCAIPFWSAKQILEINTLSKSEEMKRWDVPGEYSRPICRRIGEEAGIPRDLFGVRKRAVTVNPFAGWDVLHGTRELLTPASLRDYLNWITRNRSAWVRRGRVPPIADARLNFFINMLHMRSIDAVNSLAKVPLLWRIAKYRLYDPKYLNRYLFPWALHRAMHRYRGQDAQGLADPSLP